MAPETIRLVSETSTVSQVRMNIETLFAALDSLEKAKDERANKYQIDSTERLDAAARELQATADAARAVQKQRDLENLKNQFEADTTAFEYMTDKIDKRLEDLGYSCPEEMIEVLDRRLDRLQKIVDEADSQEKKLNDEIRALREKKRRLENRIKGGQVPQTAEPHPRNSRKSNRRKQGDRLEQGGKN
jgi:predicted  nucleic acid-binding Zn-ribbon protein